MDINKNPADAIKLHDTNLTPDNTSDVNRVNRYTDNKKNNNKDVTDLTNTNAVVCTTSNQQRQQVIQFCEKKYDPKSVVILDANNGLDNNDLLQAIHCDQDGKLTISEGRLFADEELQIIINISEMSAGEIARINDLLSSPPTYLGKPLGKNVNRLVIMDEKMLHNNSNGPAADCWRRLARLKFYEEPKDMGIHSVRSTSANNNNDEKSLQTIRPKLTTTTQQQLVTVDFSTANNWKTLVFGDLALNDQGAIYFHTGYLANIQDNKTIVLKDAPWDDEEFVSTLETALRQGGFRANGNWITLPDDLEIVQQNTDKKQLNELKSKLVVNADELEQPTIKTINTVCIDSKNLENILANTQLNQGLMCSCDTLSELIAESKYLLITSPLSEKQWLQLLNRIDKLPIKPTVVDCSKNMPDKLLQQPDSIKVKLYKHQATAIDSYQQQDHAIYQITADTNAVELWQSVALSSQNKFLFTQQNTQLLTDLQKGNPVVFYGVESNLQVMSQLETLLATPPYLFIHGKKVMLPNAKVTILYPHFENTNIKNTLFSYYLQQAEIIEQPPKNYFDYSFADDLLEKITNFGSPLQNKYIPFSQQNFTDIFAKQLQIECDLDKSATPLPVHYRKAAHNLVAKYYRDQPEIYGYLKTQINLLKPDNHEVMVDASVLKQWLKQNPNVDRNLLVKNFWSLVRHCSPACFGTKYSNNLKYLSFDGITPNTAEINILANILLGLTEDDKKDAFKQKLDLDRNSKFNDILKEKTINYIYYNGNLRSQLYDALLVMANKIDIQQPLSEIVKSLAVQIEHAIEKNPTDIAIMEVFNLLAEVFPKELLTTEINDLPELLVTGKVNHKRKQQRRIKRLTAKLQQHPIIFLRGVAGTGKSHMAKAVATEINKQYGADMPDPLIISLSPETTSQDLFGKQQLKETDKDFKTEFVTGKILAWAMNTTNPPVLIIDEANLVKDGVLALLAGLMQDPKQLVYGGKIYSLSEKHRIILTGNPDSYDGRSMDLAIKNAMLTMHYHNMNQDSLIELIIYPSLPTNWSETEKQQAIAAMLHLYTAYNDKFALNLGPRDLQDVLARMQISLMFYSKNKQPITLEQINHLIWQSFKEAIVGSIDIKQRHKLTTLADDYANSFPQNSSILTVREEQFLIFLDKLKQQNPKLQLTTQPIIDLAHNYWLFLNNQNSELITRHGMWVEGPAGWGKDVILDAVLTLWEQDNPVVSGNDFVHINANPNQWDQTIETVLSAMQKGQKLVISEINLLPSRYLEGLFNDILTQPSTSGFMLFATVNPSSFTNREILSDAFMSRVTQVKLNNLTQEQLKSILSTKITNTKLVSWLLDKYQLLDTKLKQQNSPVMLTLEDLLTLAVDMQNVNEDEWPLLFNKNFSLAIKSLIFNLSDFLINKILEELQAGINKKPIKKEIGSVLNQASTKVFMADNITNNNSFRSIRYFANYADTTKYRLQLKKVSVIQGEIVIQQIFTDNKDIEPIIPPSLPQEEPLRLKQGELLASGNFMLYKDQWVLLPGISYHDECCGIDAEQPVLLARSKTTGQLMIKLKDSIEDEQIVNINFIIKPSLININTANVTKQLDPIVQDDHLKQLLDTQIFSQEALKYESCRQLHKIKDITDPKLKIQQLIVWAQSFKYGQNATSIGNNAFFEVIQRQIGTCLHRSAAFQVIAKYFGIPTNIISNDSHSFVEFSLDNKQSWITIDLGGAPGNLTEVEPTNTPKFSNDNDNLDVDYAIISRKDSDDFFDNEGNVKPNKLVDFLIKKFPFENYEQQMGHIYANFNLYLMQDSYAILLKTIDIFSAWIKKSKQRSSLHLFEEARKYTTICILSIYDVYKSLLLHKDKDLSELFKHTLGTLTPIIDELGLVAPMLLLLEDLKLDDSYSKNIIKVLDNFYQQLAENKQPQIEYIQEHKNKYDLVDTEYVELSGNSKTLLNALQRVSLKKYWSYTNTGKSPNLTRLATKKPAFPFNQDAKNSQVATFIVASNSYNLQNELTKIFTDFINNQANNAKFQQLYDDYNGSINVGKLSGKATTVVSSFIALVFKSCTNDCTILFDNDTAIGDRFVAKLNMGHLQVDPNIYSFEEYATLYLNCSNYNLDEQSLINPELNIEMLRKNFNKSTGLLLTTEFLSICFEEYLETIDWSKLLK